MTDIHIEFNSNLEHLSFETRINKGDFESESGIRSAVLYSLFTDRQAEPDDVIPDGSNNRRGHWADTFNTESEGSRLWLLRREKRTQHTLNRAVGYAEECLQWLIEDGHAISVEVHGEWQGLGLLALKIIINLSDGQRFDDVFNTRL